MLPVVFYISVWIKKTKTLLFMGVAQLTKRSILLAKLMLEVCHFLVYGKNICDHLVTGAKLTLGFPQDD